MSTILYFGCLVAYLDVVLYVCAHLMARLLWVSDDLQPVRHDQLESRRCRQLRSFAVICSRPSLFALVTCSPRSSSGNLAKPDHSMEHVQTR